MQRNLNHGLGFLGQFHVFVDLEVVFGVLDLDEGVEVVFDLNGRRG